MAKGYVVVEQYRTGDGQLHSSPDKALKYIESEICDGFREVLRKMNTKFLTETDIVSISLLLYQHRAELLGVLKLEELGEDTDG